MKNFLKSCAALAAAAVTLTTSGCLKYDQKAVIQKDGSGTLKESFTVDLDAWKKLQELVKSFTGGSPGGEPAETEGAPEASLPITLPEIQERAKKVAGLKISHAKDGRRYVADFDASFSTWGTLGEANLFLGSAELVKNADGSFTFTLDALAGQAGKMNGGPGADAGGMGMDPSMIMAMVEPLVGSLEFNQSLTLPGEIVDTNGTKGEDGKSVSWKIGFKDLTAGKGANLMKVTFKGEGLDLKTFKYAPDVMDLLNRAQGTGAKPAPTTTPGTGPEAPAMDAPKAPVK